MAVLILLIALQLPSQAPVPCGANAVMRAAVVDALGDGATVTLETLACELPEGVAADVALPEPGARLGRPVRFRLLQGDRQVGYAIAQVEANVRHVRAAKPLAGGAPVAADDIEEETGPVDGQLLERLPTATEVLGQTTVRSVAPGDILTTKIVRVPPAVRSGARVVTRVVVNGVEARGTATAQQSGGIGDVIRLVNADTRRQLRGRIVGKNLVEVMQ